MLAAVVIAFVLFIIIWFGNRLRNHSWVCYLILESFNHSFSQYYLISPSELRAVQNVIHRPDKSRIHI